MDHPRGHSPALVGVIGAMVIIGTFAAYLFYLQGITDAGPVRAGLVGCVEPVSATVISAVWLGTPVRRSTWWDRHDRGMVLLVTQREEASAQGRGRPGRIAAYDLPPFQGRAIVLGYYGPPGHARRLRAREGAARGRPSGLATLGIEEKASRSTPPRAASCAPSMGHDLRRGVDARSEAGDEAASSDAERIIGVFARRPARRPRLRRT